MLRLPPNGVITRYTKLFLAFAISGCMHVGHDVGGAVEARGGAMHFFCIQFVGIVIEDAVQALFRRGRVRKDKGSRRGQVEQGSKKEAAGWERWVGRVWVAVFLVWSTPVFQYPVMSAKRRQGDDMLPFSFARSLRPG